MAFNKRPNFVTGLVRTGQQVFTPTDRTNRTTESNSTQHSLASDGVVPDLGETYTGI